MRERLAYCMHQTRQFDNGPLKNIENFDIFEKYQCSKTFEFQAGYKRFFNFMANGISLSNPN